MDDVVGNLMAFEAMNNVRLELRLASMLRHGKPDLAVTALAFPKLEESMEQPHLALVRLTCSALNLRTLDAALIHALYLLDGQIASNELERENLK